MVYELLTLLIYNSSSFLLVNSIPYEKMKTNESSNNPWMGSGSELETNYHHIDVPKTSSSYSIPKGKASSRQTPSQKSALERIRNNQQMKSGHPSSQNSSGSISGPNSVNGRVGMQRRVVNYAKAEEFDDKRYSNN
jgi:hypothetical protein